MIKKKKKTFNATCENCNTYFTAYRKTARFCPSCREKLRIDHIRVKMRERRQQEKNWKRMEAGIININPYFLNRGDVLKHLRIGNFLNE